MKCRVCAQFSESVCHLVCSCPTLAPSLYLNIWHNQIAKVLYQELIQCNRLILHPPEVTNNGDQEIWFDIMIKTTPKVVKNKPDIVIWDKKHMSCKIVEITVPLDTNLEKATKEKQLKYIDLVTKMQSMYKGYSFNTLVISVGAMGAIPKTLERNLHKLFPNKNNIDMIIQRLQKAAILGTVKVCKTVMSM